MADLDCDAALGAKPAGGPTGGLAHEALSHQGDVSTCKGQDYREAGFPVTGRHVEAHQGGAFGKSAEVGHHLGLRREILLSRRERRSRIGYVRIGISGGYFIRFAIRGSRIEPGPGSAAGSNRRKKDQSKDRFVRLKPDLLRVLDALLFDRFVET